MLLFMIFPVFPSFFIPSRFIYLFFFYFIPIFLSLDLGFHLWIATNVYNVHF